MKVLACGGRDMMDRQLVFDTLDGVHERKAISLIIHGAASGADRLAGEWAKERELPCDEYPADWNSRWVNGRRIYDRAAGFKRNAQMLVEGKPDLTLAFPGGRGTADMIQRALRAGVAVVQVMADGRLRKV